MVRCPDRFGDFGLFPENCLTAGVGVLGCRADGGRGAFLPPTRDLRKCRFSGHFRSRGVRRRSGAYVLRSREIGYLRVIARRCPMSQKSWFGSFFARSIRSQCSKRRERRVALTWPGMRTPRPAPTQIPLHSWNSSSSCLLLRRSCDRIVLSRVEVPPPLTDAGS